MIRESNEKYYDLGHHNAATRVNPYQPDDLASVSLALSLIHICIVIGGRALAGFAPAGGVRSRLDS